MSRTLESALCTHTDWTFQCFAIHRPTLHCNVSHRPTLQYFCSMSFGQSNCDSFIVRTLLGQCYVIHRPTLHLKSTLFNRL